MKKLFNFRLLVLIGVLITSLTTQMWAYDAGFSLRGTSASISSGHEVNTYFGTDSKYCIYIWLTKNETFYLVNTSSTAYGPSTDNKEVKHGTAEAAGTYNSNKWKYTGNTGLVRICVDQSSNEWYPKVSVEEMTTILTGSQIMFYFGDSWGWGTKYINDGSSDVFSGNAGFNEKSTYFTIARVAAARYYVSNQAKTNWGGVQMEATASAGAFYRLNNDGGSNAVSTTAGVVPTFGTTSYSKATGTVNSGIAVNTLGKSSTSRDQTVYYYYSTDGGTTWTGFSPSDISGLAANTYKVRAIACDGLICVKSSNEATLTIADAPVVNLSVEDGSSNVISSALSGQTITLKATASHCGSTPTISYRYSTSSSFASYTQIASTTSTSQTWTVPASTSEVTYYLRAYVTSSGYECNTSNSTLTAYGKKTIHVRDNNNWGTSNIKIHHWGTNDANATDWPGTTVGISSMGGQWFNVVVYSCYDGFVLNNGTGTNNQDKTVDLLYTGSGSVTNDGYYTMSTNGSEKQTLSSASSPTAPTSVATTATPTSVTNVQMTLGGSIGTNGNDNITDYGFYWGTTDACGTKAQVGTSNTTGSISKQITGLTAGTTYYFKTYATNGQGTTYGDVKSYKLPYKVTITKPTGCASMSPAAGTRYVKVGDNISATASTGYTFTSWTSTNLTLGTPTTTDGVTTSEITAISADNGTIQPVYTQNMTTITITANNKSAGSITVGGAAFAWDGTTTAGVATTRALVVTPAAGYYFSGWTRSDGADFHLSGYGEANTSVTLTGDGAGLTSGQTLTANFQPLEKIYFRNVFDDGVNEPTRWSNVYVYFGITWESGRAVSNSNASFKVAMTQIGETDVYWAYVPRAFTLTAAPLGKQVAFSNASYTTSFMFYHETASHDKAATRGDYNKALNMFVPHHTAKSVNTGSGGVDYFDNGYWMKYDTRASQGAGYYLKKYNSRDSYTQEGEFIATNDDATFIQFTLRIDAASSTLNYMITSAGALNYVAASTVTAANCSDIALNENTETLSDHDVKFSLTTASEGMYTFIIDQSGDKMKLNVLYPVAVGDYRLKHEYTDGSAKSSYSDVIKSGEAASGKTVSMYLNMAPDAKSLKLEKCTAVTAGKPVWGSSTTVGTGSGLFNTTTFSKGKGVYQFDVTVATDAVSTIANAGLYEGNYYIKTDCAPGGWANYKQNILNTNTINFSSSDANTFDYFFCKNISSAGTNVKFVVANDYNNAVSDTLVADATYLTTSGGGTSKEFLPEACCVRFSYNSATNTVKRAYLRYSGNNNFLNIIPSASGKVFDAASAGNDLYNSGNAGVTNKFGNDDGNFVYRKTVYAVSDATIDIKAEYTTSSKKQTFVSGKTLISSNNASPRYPVRLVYDFKTNHLTTAWEATEGLTDKLSGIEFIYVRDGQDAANQVTLGSGGALTNSKVCGVFQFDYDKYVGRVGAWPQYGSEETGYTNKMCIFYFSFPFDVNVSDIFGIGTYGKEWKIQYYDGAGRAKKGFFRGDGTTTFWKDVPADSVLTANVGYSLMLDNDYFNTTSSGMVFEGKTSGKSVFLYFPSASAISIQSGSRTITVPEHKCTINRTFYDATLGKTVNHRYTDTDWNMMGVPLFSNQAATNYSGTFNQEGDTCNYIYTWSYADNKLSVNDAKSFTFNAMHAYMVQYHGNVTFTGSVIPASVAARRTPIEGNYKVELQVLNGNEEMINHTYVELKENACDTFALDEDLYMSPNGRVAEIFSFAGEYDVAANVLSVANHTVELGMSIRTAGTYTISMPSIFSGTVTLVDTYNQTRTNLELGDYDVYLEPGTYVGRFYLELDITNAPTAIDGAENGEGTLKDGKAHKFIMNDMMYILRDGIIYDAQGKKVK